MTNLIPFFESIPLGTKGRGAAMLGRTLYYSTPQEEIVTLTGFHMVLSYIGTLPQFDLSLCESKTADIWTPFYMAPVEAVAGLNTGGVEIVRQLPAPYVIQPGRRIQIAIQVPGGYPIPSGNPRDTFTLVGVRDLIGGLGNASA
jgi:hypothetical protein